MKKQKRIVPNVIRGGVAIPLGANYFLMKGKTHEQGGIDIGKDLEVENGERIQEFFGRVFECVNDIKEENNDKNVLLVTHGGVARAIDCYFNGIPEDKEDTGKFMLGNCEVREYKL